MLDCSVTFEKGSPIWQLCQKLKEAGVKDSDLGIPETDQTKNEKLDYELERYKRHQLELPWSLDTTTSFDAEAEQKANRAVTAFKQILTAKGLKEGEVEYNKSLAISVYAFAMTAPQRGSLLKVQISANIKGELEKLGLTNTVSYLEEYGGLGTVENE